MTEVRSGYGHVRQRRNCFATSGARAIAATLLLVALGGTPAAAMSQQAQQQASQLYQKHDWQALSTLATRAAASDPRDGFAWYYAGLADDGLGRKDAAAAAYLKALPNMPGYLQDSVIQLLAQDYVALHQPDKLVALHLRVEKSNPQIARALETQFPAIIVTPALQVAALPDVSPRTLASLKAKIRSSWWPDAVPMMVIFDSGRTSGFEADFYSPSTRAGLMVNQGPTGMTTMPVADPRWGSTPILDDFLALAAAVTRTPGASAPGALQRAVLYRTTDDPSDRTSLVWDLSVGANDTHGARVVAYIMRKEEFNRLLASANGGDAKAQYALAQVYATGVAGRPDLEQATAWLTKAANRGNLQAGNKLGQYYQLGIGVPVDADKAARWYRWAANAGFAPAQFNLGLLYEMGLGVPQDWVQADRWITEAAKHGLQAAYAELGMVRQAAKREQHLRELAAAQRRMEAANRGRMPDPVALQHANNEWMAAHHTGE